MKLVIAIIKPFKLDDVRDALTAIGVAGHDRHRGQGLRPPEGPHRDLPRRRIRRELPAQDQDRGRGRRTSASTRWSRRSPRPPRPARSATARSSSSTSSRPCASAPARPTPTRCRSSSCRASIRGRRMLGGTTMNGRHARRGFGACLLRSLLARALAPAMSPQRRRPKIDAGDTAWMIAATALVLMMTHPGPRAVLLRHGAQEERARHHGAELRGGRAWCRSCGRCSATRSPSRGDGAGARQSRPRVPARHRHGHGAASSPRRSPKSCS